MPLQSGSWKVFRSCKKRLIRKKHFPEGEGMILWLIGLLLCPGIVKSDHSARDAFLVCFLFQKFRACYSFVLSVTELPRGELRTAFKFKRTTAFCSLGSPETWPKTRKGCLARALCQRFNIWILLRIKSWPAYKRIIKSSLQYSSFPTMESI